MLMTKDRSSPATPVRARSPHSMMIAASNSPSARGAILIPGTPANAIIGAGAASALITVTSLPRARSANAMASCDPIESPSGRACDDTTNRCRARIASTIRSTVALVVIGRMVAGFDFVEQLFDAILPGDGLVVEERQLG